MIKMSCLMWKAKKKKAFLFKLSKLNALKIQIDLDE